jgi:RNA polymerase sigma factor (sigma-70 family)
MNRSLFLFGEARLMARHPLRTVLDHLRRLRDVAAAAQRSDRELLRAFATNHDQDAFAVVVMRHAPLVWGVCRRILGHHQDAEDAFQATFLILARRAGSVRWQASVGGWLHTVAQRLAVRARKQAQQRRIHEREAKTPSDGASLRELAAVVDEELRRLPAKYREPLLLHYLEGATAEAAARQLGLSRSTFYNRLTRGRELLRERLSRQGSSLAAPLLAAALTAEAEAASQPLIQATIRGVMGNVSERVAALAAEALGATAMMKLKIGLALGLLLGIAAGGVAMLTPREPMTPLPQTQRPSEPPKAEEKAVLRVDRYGDPLPPGAVARMGSVQLRHLRAHIAFTADGKTVISGGPDGRICFWDVATGRLLREKHVRRLPEHAFLNFEDALLSTNGKFMAVHDGQRVYVHDAGTGDERWRIPAGPYMGPRFTLSADGKILALWKEMPRNTLHLWDVSAGKERWTLKHPSRVGQFVFSADGKLLASSSNALLHFWDTSTGQEIGNVHCEARSLAFAPDGKLLASSDSSGAATLWETATRKKRTTLKPSPDISGGYYSGDRGLAFSPDGSLLAVAGNEALVFWDVAEQKEVRRLPDRKAQCLVFAPDGKTLACASEIEILLWDGTRGRQLHQRPGHDRNLASIAVSPDGKILASIDWDRSLRLWDAATGKPLDWRPNGRFRGVTSTFSPDGKWFIGAGNGAVQFWDAATGKQGRRFLIEDLRGAKSKHEVWELALSPDGRRLTALSTDDRGFQLNVWETRTSQSIARRSYRERTLPHSSVLTPDGEGVIVPNIEGTTHIQKDSTLVLEETATGQRLLTIPRKLGYPLTFSSDGKLLAAGIHRTIGMERGYAGKSISVTEMATGEEVLRIDGPLAPILFSPDGRLLATIDAVGDGGLRIWDVATGKQLFRRAWPDDAARHAGWSPAASLAFFPGGRKLATGMLDGTVLVWDLAPETWPKRGFSRTPGEAGQPAPAREE